MTNIPAFNNQDLFEQVFIHRSYLNESREKSDSNERLEFLGDSILSFIVSTHIYKEHPDLKEGELTSIRSILTNTETLYLISRELDLGNRLKMSKGELASGGRENKTILANTFEALLGGIFLDQGIEVARLFVENTILVKAKELIDIQGMKDPKSKLQEKTQENNKTSPVYKILNESGPDHAKVYTVGVYLGEQLLAEGIGKSKQDAEKNAAQNALKI